MKLMYYNIARQLGYEKIYPDLKERIYALKTETEICSLMTKLRHLSMKK